MKRILKLSEQTIWQILGKVVTSVSTFIILWFVSRTYHEEGTGVYTLSLTYLSIFYLFSDFGFNAHVLREKAENNWNKLLGGRILWSAVLVVVSLGLLPFLPFANPGFSQAVLFGSLAILGSGIFVTSNLIFQSRHRYDLSIVASSVGTLAGLAATVYFINRSLPVPFLLLGQLLGWLIIGITSLLLAGRLIKNILPVYDLGYMTGLFKDSWPIAATLALNVIYFRSDVFLLSVLKSNAEVGIYNVAYSVFQVVLVLPTFIMNAYYPMLLKSLKDVKKIAGILLLLSFLGIIFTYILSPKILPLLTGGGFPGSIRSLQILALGFPAFFVSSLLMWLLVTKGKYKPMLAIYVIGLLVNFLLNLVFIPKYSFFASSYITVVSEYLILALQAGILLR